MAGLRQRFGLLVALAWGVPVFAAAQQGTGPTQGIFQGSTDIGKAQTGSTVYDAATKTDRIAGGGQEVWSGADDFRLVWTKVSGDTSLSADVVVAQPPTFSRSKGMLMIRQSLAPNAPYADIAIHGDGHIAMQWRLTPGGETKDTTLKENGSLHLRIERKGDRFTAYATTGTTDTANPPTITIPLGSSVYVGVGVCAHDDKALQTVTFSNIRIDSGTASTTASATR